MGKKSKIQMAEDAVSRDKAVIETVAYQSAKAQGRGFIGEPRPIGVKIEWRDR